MSTRSPSKALEPPQSRVPLSLSISTHSQHAFHNPHRLLFNYFSISVQFFSPNRPSFCGHHDSPILTESRFRYEIPTMEKKPFLSKLSPFVSTRSPSRAKSPLNPTVPPISASLHALDAFHKKTFEMPRGADDKRPSEEAGVQEDARQCNTPQNQIRLHQMQQ